MQYNGQITSRLLQAANMINEALALCDAGSKRDHLRDLYLRVANAPMDMWLAEVVDDDQEPGWAIVAR